MQKIYEFPGNIRFLVIPILVLVTFLSNIPSLYATAYQSPDGRIFPGMTTEEVETIMGKPEHVLQVTRYFFDGMGQAVVLNEKVFDIRLDKNDPESSPAWNFRQNRDRVENKLRFVRIGNNLAVLQEIVGHPTRIEAGEDWYYADRQHIIEINESKVEAVHSHRQTGLAKLDWVKLNFSPGALLIMNITLAFIMFGVALQIRLEHFSQLLKEPKSLILGIFSQFLALPALTFLMVYFLKPTPSVALGMILVAACPGGNISNFMSSVAKGNTALSISLTAFATLVAVFMTPVNFAFWGNLYSETANMVIPIRIDFFEMLRTVLLLLGIPVVAGIWFARRFPGITTTITNPLKKISMMIFIVFVIMALLGNLEFFKSYIHLIFFIVLAHNALALLTGFSIATLGRTSIADRRSLTIETGIQNSGLGLVLIFNPRLFDGLGGMAFIAAWWGIWHIISGLAMAWLWSRKPLPSQELKTSEVPANKS